MATIVVGVDGSESAAKALRWAAEEARLRDATLVVLHAWHFVYGGGPELVLPAPNIEDVEADARTVLHDIVKEAEDDLAGLLVEERVVHGDAGGALVAASAAADVVVIGSRGRGGVAGLLLGSVSQHVAHRATCPVVIVR
jgi:nucleotide-binding universal stress UspA family protein